MLFSGAAQLIVGSCRQMQLNPQQKQPQPPQPHHTWLGKCILPFKAKGEPWCRGGCIPQGCPLSMVFIVGLYVPWCRRLEAAPLVGPQLYADNLKCSSVCPRALIGAARFTVQYVTSVSPGKCVLLSTSKAVRKNMKFWDVLVRRAGCSGYGRSSGLH